MFEVAINSVPLKLMSLGFLKKTPTKLVGDFLCKKKKKRKKKKKKKNWLLDFHKKLKIINSLYIYNVKPCYINSFFFYFFIPLFRLFFHGYKLAYH